MAKFGIAEFGIDAFGVDAYDRGPASFLTQVSLFTAGWRNERRVAVAALRASWTINGPGRLSCLFPADTMLRPRDLKGLWLFWEHGTCGVWAGIVEDLPDDFSGGTWEIGAYSMASLLSHRRGPRLAKPSRAQAGGLAKIALRTAESPGRLWITTSIFEGVGPDLEMEWTGDLVSNVFAQLVSASGQEWRVTTARDRTTTLEWRKRVGRDLRKKVQIADGYGLAGGRLESSIGIVENDRLAIAGEEQWQRRQAVVVEDRASILLYGRRQGPATPYPGLVREASLRSAAKEDIGRLKRAAQPTTVVISQDNALGWRNIPLRVREGDTVRLLRGGQRTPFDFRIITREVDTVAGTMTLTGDATAAATAWERT